MYVLMDPHDPDECLGLLTRMVLSRLVLLIHLGFPSVRVQILVRVQPVVIPRSVPQNRKMERSVQIRPAQSGLLAPAVWRSNTPWIRVIPLGFFLLNMELHYRIRMDRFGQVTKEIWSCKVGQKSARN
ncbi:hypothetical protein L1987_84526 [Smallanthus sonchifolius]|uniref:Uncharacterized protein n=1 Tax=Smallanthus sonchifolius TaxID=185202 RepID=A0ACB8YGH1_9ASTR|nr:hypothetical protein L1987_84526 [Smallanthus sonchifolius]